MPFPAFFDEAPRLRVRDPLAAFLGAPVDGVIDYGYADAVRLAGHSCPTVAGAWLMTIKAMAALWPDTLPERGAVSVLLDDPQDEGVTGVMAAVAGLVTGAAGPGGFKGIAGRFGRNDLLRFAADTGATLAFRRTDTGAGVAAHYHSERVPADPEMRTCLHKVLGGSSDAAELARFGALWQDRVRRILVDHADDPGLVRLAAI
ncbi:MAG: hypothetical protein HYU60_07945 [Magnetospirillum sp.]|nr:hypothetical protein [Magnetospirillum sp.]